MNQLQAHQAHQAATFQAYQRILFAILDDAARELPAHRVTELLHQLDTRAATHHGLTIDPR